MDVPLSIDWDLIYYLGATFKVKLLVGYILCIEQMRGQINNVHLQMLHRNARLGQ